MKTTTLYLHSHSRSMIQKNRHSVTNRTRRRSPVLPTDARCVAEAQVVEALHLWGVFVCAGCKRYFFITIYFSARQNVYMDSDDEYSEMNRRGPPLDDDAGLENEVYGLTMMSSGEVSSLDPTYLRKFREIREALDKSVGMRWHRRPLRIKLDLPDFLSFEIREPYIRVDVHDCYARLYYQDEHDAQISFCCNNQIDAVSHIEGLLNSFSLKDPARACSRSRVAKADRLA